MPAAIDEFQDVLFAAQLSDAAYTDRWHELLSFEGEATVNILRFRNVTAVVARRADKAYLAIPGVSEWRDIRDVLDGRWRVFVGHEFPAGILSHTHGVYELLVSHRREIKKAWEGASELIIAGHSLGGGVAASLPLLLQTIQPYTQFPRVRRVYTFCTPRYAIRPTHPAFYTCTNFLNIGDVISLIPSVSGLRRGRFGANVWVSSDHEFFGKVKVTRHIRELFRVVCHGWPFTASSRRDIHSVRRLIQTIEKVLHVLQD